MVLVAFDATLNPNNATVEYTGYLSEWTHRQVIVMSNVHCQRRHDRNHPARHHGRPHPHRPAPPPALPIAIARAANKNPKHPHLATSGDFVLVASKCRTAWNEPVLLRKLERQGFEPLTMGVVIASMATLDLPARDAHGAKLTLEIVRCLDVVVPRRLAIVRHAGELVENATQGLAATLHLRQLPVHSNNQFV